MNEKPYQITSSNYSVTIGSLLNSDFEIVLSENYKNARKIIFVDENTHEYCLEYLIANFSELSEAEVIVLPAGEANKNIEICAHVWEALAEYKITRKDVAICLGGGVVTDMGGFIASLYKRGIDFIHIPTSLLAMVDASIGGKTGVDLGSVKNIIGVFANPKAVYIDPAFLATLPLEDQIGGWMEMLKHGLIADKKHWEELQTIDFHDFSIDVAFIHRSLAIKNTIVLADPKEENIRKKLNFGHTFGHAVESLFLENNHAINHGIAVGIGMIVEAFWSVKSGLLAQAELEEIVTRITDKVVLPSLENVTEQHLWEYMLNDKKNENEEVLATLLTTIGEATINQAIPIEWVEEGLAFYKAVVE